MDQTKRSAWKLGTTALRVAEVGWPDRRHRLVGVRLHLEGVEQEDRLLAIPLDLDRVAAFRS